MFNFVRVLFAGLVLFSGGAFAESYSWRVGTFTGDSPLSACTAFLSSMDYYAPFKITKASSPNQFHCWGMSPRYNESFANGTASRSGDSCPVGTEYNAETGECVPEPNPDPQDCEIGDEITRKTYSPPGGSPNPSPQICSNQCLYDFERRSAIGLEEPGFPGVGKFTAYYVGNGQSCTNPTPPEQPPPPTEPPPPDPIDPVEPTDPEQGGGGSSGGGSSGGGSSGGGSSGGGSSGGGSSGGGSSGGGSSGGGSSGGGSSGGGSSGGGSSGGGSSGDGNGGGSNGNGNGDGDGEGEGDGSAEGVENCEAGRCDFGDNRGDPFGGEVRSFADSLAAAMNGMKNSPLGNSIGNIQFPTGGSCPTGSTSINIGIGSIPINFVEHCNFWQQIAPILSAVFLALWSILAVRVFLSA